MAVNTLAPPAQTKLDALHIDSLLQHTACHVCSFCAPKKVTAKGNTEATIMIVGEAPGETEAQHGTPFVGAAGKMLDHLLDTVGLTAKDVWVTNSLMCRPPKNRLPTVTEIAACNGRLRYEISIIKPKVIIPMGNTALRAILNSPHGVTKLQGETTWHDAYQAFIVPTFHPASLLYLGGDQNYRDVVATLRKAVRMREFPPGELPTLTTEWLTVDIPDQARELLAVMRGKSISICALDIETTGLDWWADDIICWQFCWEPGRVAVFWHAALEDATVRQELCAFLNKPSVEWVMWNGKFDKKFMDRYFRLRELESNISIGFDGMLAHYLLDERRGVHSLKQNARDYLDADSYEDELKPYLAKKNPSYLTIPKPILEEYAARDADYTLRLREPLLREMQEDNVYALYRDHTMPVANTLCEIEEYGVLFNHDAASELRTQFKADIATMLVNLDTQARKLGFDPLKVTGQQGKPLKSAKSADVFNPNSSPHVCHLIYDVLKTPLFSTGGKARKQRTAAVDALESLKNKEPIIEEILEYRRKVKTFSTFLEGLQNVAREDGRIRTEFLLHGTQTGRISSRSPNLQNIPRGDYDGGLIRRLFIAPPGYVFVIADYSQLELRIAANYAEDPALCDNLGPGRDLHAETASSIFKKPISELTEHDRVRSKMITFGILFGRQPYALAKGDLDCTIEEAEEYVANFFARYPKLKEWLDQVRARVKTHGVVVSAFGRKRRFPLLTDANKHRVRNQATNAPIQGLASDVTLESVCRAHNWLTRQNYGRCVLTVHDSGIFEIREDLATDALLGIKSIMEDPTLERMLDFPVEIKVGPNWADAKRWSP